MQNYPVLTSASPGRRQTTIAGNLNSVANTTFRLEFSANTTADATGNGEGQTFLGSHDVTTDGSGNTAFNAILPLLPPAGQISISSTATDPDNNTSEFSATIEASVGTGQVLKVSTRLRVLTDANVLIGGFIILGSDPKEVIVRAIGPSLGNFGVPDLLADPMLELHDGSGTTIATNDDWKDTQQGRNRSHRPAAERRSGARHSLHPRARRLGAIVRGALDTTGVGLVEVYHLD